MYADLFMCSEAYQSLMAGEKIEEALRIIFRGFKTSAVPMIYCVIVNLM